MRPNLKLQTSDLQASPLNPWTAHDEDALGSAAMETTFGRREFLEGVAGLAALSVVQRDPAAVRAPSSMYVGSFTGKDGGHGDGVSVYRRNGESERWTLVQQLKELADPSFLIIDRAR